MVPFRIGHGFDVHKFGEGDHIVIGGVTIPYEKGLVAHSDGDVALHALTDALLGAAALGDIGKHFPDTDAEFAGANSRGLLRQVFSEIRKLGWLVGNVDVTIIAQAPQMRPHIDAMRTNIAADLAIDMSATNVKATTTEKLGFTGRKEGIAVEAVALLYRDNT
ncbi:2-C-methyl-D-erythritol 2,4-cyclodiphosphate synthase [Marinomonas gallaica]|uniref:2-C-methyl-D-erythritol 2,4-cyclodiphosphate synthase n=1 Tax=Marinomonas gallaica TaxID=1806667 RepID=UPI003CE46451